MQHYSLGVALEIKKIIIMLTWLWDPQVGSQNPYVAAVVPTRETHYRRGMLTWQLFGPHVGPTAYVAAEVHCWRGMLAWQLWGPHVGPTFDVAAVRPTPWAYCWRGMLTRQPWDLGPSADVAKAGPAVLMCHGEVASKSVVFAVTALQLIFQCCLCIFYFFY